MNPRWPLKPAALLCALTSAFMLSACDRAAPLSAQQTAPEVQVLTLKTAALNITTDLPGRTSAYRVAEVRPQVSGIILQRQFAEGSDVHAGEALYQIDPAPYLAAQRSAKGALAQAQANANIAALTVRRYQPLLGSGYISQQDYDQARATAQQTQAALESARAAVKSADINLTYSHLTAPIDGRIGRSAVSEGALVQRGQSDQLATIQQLDPLYVDVTQSGEDFMRLRQQMAEGKLTRRNGKAEVTLLLANGQTYAQKGTLEFSDVTVDQTTGAITLRAILPNPQHQLLPGMFVRARLEAGVDPQALLVPQQAITRTPRGMATTLVVDKNNKVALRNITVSQAVGDQWRVTSGLQAGERVIVSGIQRAQPGVTVKASEITGDSKLPSPVANSAA
ncbi:efflux RND transporter periplasmic adaptor subunit [Pantoea sp. B65]|uniref:efflux RND transporter periplasmic adaptor subunit n=1 Tax=Pantoea sp. B65 TaxID=2813359 RepID=UPI0039B549F5